MTPVKEYGGCGGYGAAMSANSVLEASIAMKTGKEPQRLSDQQLLDCTVDTEQTRELFGELDSYNYGCTGGLMDRHWKFQ